MQRSADESEQDPEHTDNNGRDDDANDLSGRGSSLSSTGSAGIHNLRLDSQSQRKEWQEDIVGLQPSSRVPLRELEGERRKEEEGEEEGVYSL